MKNELNTAVCWEFYEQFLLTAMLGDKSIKWNHVLKNTVCVTLKFGYVAYMQRGNKLRLI